MRRHRNVLPYWVSHLLWLAPALLEAQAAPSAPGQWALPGAGTVPEADMGSRTWTCVGGAGFAVTDRLYGVTGYEVPAGMHYRAEGSLALASRPLPWLALALRLDGRYDRHPDDDNGPDDGWTGTPWLLLRGAWRLGPGRLGAELRWGGTGWKAPDLRLDASVVESWLSYTWSRCGPCLGVTAAVGYRIDGSASAVPNPERLRPGDLSALEASESNAALLGLAVRLPLPSGELWAALSAEPLLGAQAPDTLQQPASIALGYRHALGRSFWLLSGLAWRPTAAPFLDPSTLLPVRPRLRLWAGLALDLMPVTRPAAGGPSPSEANLLAQPARGARDTVALDLTIRNQDGTPLRDARVRLLTPDGTLVTEGRSDASGRVRLAMPSGGIDAEGLSIEVTAEGYTATKVGLEAARGQGEIVLEPRVVPGELRGLVRTFSGRPLPATVRVQPGEHHIEVDREGRFELPLPPGDYEVQIEAQGYRGQQRRVHIEEGGVTVLNVELRRARRR